MIGLIQKLNQNMPKVLISDSLDNIASEILKKNNISVDTKTNLSPEELKKIIDNYDGLIIRSATKVRKDLIAVSYTHLTLPTTIEV